MTEVDVMPRTRRWYRGRLERFKFRLSRLLVRAGKKIFSYENGSTFRYVFEYFTWWLRLNRYYRRALANTDAIVFAGGGFLKFRTQGLNYYVEQIVRLAEKHNKPVMFNAVGIEGYDDSDVRCQKLKAAINSPCVKVITTRDDIDILETRYCNNPETVTALVGDPALWTPECFETKRNTQADTIGINVIRGKIYQDYGNSLSPNELKQFYVDLLQELTRRGEKWVLFSNGMSGDCKFALEILEELHVNPDDFFLPAPRYSREFLDQLKNFRVVFGARLHACITAFSMGIPVVGLIWSEKAEIFSRLLDESEYYFRQNDLDPLRVADSLIESAGRTIEQSKRDELRNLTKVYLEHFLDEYVNWKA